MNDLAGDEVIRSPANPTLKRIRSLRQRNTRELERAFVVEGVRAVEDGLKAGGRAQVILLRGDADWRPSNSSGEVPIRRVVPQIFDELAETETPQPVLAVFDFPRLIPGTSSAPLFLVVDGVRDPGNLGTLLRSAAAAGATAAVVMPGTVDPYNGKTVRAGMGAHFRIPIVSLDESLRNIIVASCPVRVLTNASAELIYDRISLDRGTALIVGSEAHGPSNFGRTLATCEVKIPLENGVESLNAGVAGSIMLFEAARQRRR